MLLWLCQRASDWFRPHRFSYGSMAPSFFKSFKLAETFGTSSFKRYERASDGHHVGHSNNITIFQLATAEDSVHSRKQHPRRKKRAGRSLYLPECSIPEESKKAERSQSDPETHCKTQNQYSVRLFFQELSAKGSLLKVGPQKGDDQTAERVKTKTSPPRSQYLKVHIKKKQKGE